LLSELRKKEGISIQKGKMKVLIAICGKKSLVKAARWNSAALIKKTERCLINDNTLKKNGVRQQAHLVFMSKEQSWQ
jgi:hypothetical protein